MSISISLCMIVKNEEHNLTYCLDSVHDLVDEINIIDTGSTDKTIEIAKKYTERIFHFDWIDDFSAARNFSFSKATKDYIFWLDADDVMYEQDREKFKTLKKTLNTEADIVYMDYIYSKDAAGNPLIIQSRERLLKRSRGFQWKNKIHETLSVSGNYTIADININHDHYDFKKSFTRNRRMIDDIMKSNTASTREMGYHIRHLITDGHYEEALSDFAEFERRNKTDKIFAADLYVQIHQIYMNKGDLEKAYLILAENEELLKNKCEYNCALGDFAKDILKDIPLAINYYNKALSCPGSNDKGIKMLTDDDFYYFLPNNALGLCYLSLKNYSMAAKHFKTALQYKNDINTQAILEKINNLLDKM